LLLTIAVAVARTKPRLSDGPDFTNTNDHPSGLEVPTNGPDEDTPEI
jgi:hypothetical protein